MTTAPQSDLATAQRWERFGGALAVLDRSAGSVTIALLRCDGGEEVDRLTSTEPGLLAWLDARD